MLKSLKNDEAMKYDLCKKYVLMLHACLLSNILDLNIVLVATK